MSPDINSNLSNDIKNMATEEYPLYMIVRKLNLQDPIYIDPIAIQTLKTPGSTVSARYELIGTMVNDNQIFWYAYAKNHRDPASPWYFLRGHGDPHIQIAQNDPEFMKRLTSTDGDEAIEFIYKRLS